MGALRDMLERAMRDSRNAGDGATDALKVLQKYRDSFSKIVGKPVIWKAAKNPVFSTPQLVIIDQPYDYFVVVKKRVYNVDGEASIIHFTISYSSLISAYEHVELLNGKRGEEL
jgi:hypothetical protein